MENEQEEVTTVLAPNEMKSLQPDWANPPTVADLKEDYVEAKIDHDSHVTDVTTWLDNLNITGSAVIKVPKGRSRVQPKTIRKQAEWRYPSISAPFLSGRDVFNVYPQSVGDKERAQQNQAVLNNQFNHRINKVKFIDDVARTIVDEGTVFVYTGWRHETEEYEEMEYTFSLVQAVNQAEVAETMELLQRYASDPETFEINESDLLVQVVKQSMQDQVPYKAVIDSSEMVTKTRNIANHPEPEVLDYRTVIPDPTCEGDLSKASFIIRLFESSLSALKKEGDRYSNLDQIVPDNSNTVRDEYGDANESTFQFKDKPRQKLEVVEYWGYWDIHDDGEVVSIVASWIGNVMVRLEENPTPDKSLPFESAQLLPQRKSNYGQPDGELIIDNQKLIGAATRGTVDLLAKSANAQVGSAKDALDPLNLRKFKSGEDYQYNPNSDPSRAFYMHKFPEIPRSAWEMTQAQQQDAESMTGIASFSGPQGLSGDSLGGTATGVDSVVSATGLRNADILRRIADLIKRIGRKYVAMNAVFLTEDEVVRITNDQFVEVRVDDLAGNFDIELAISTPEEDQAKAKELAFMLQTVGPNADPKITFTIMADIARLRKMPDLAEKLDNYEPQPDPMAVAIKELEAEKLRWEIEKIKSETQENYANAQLDQAKVGTEQAKASNLQSDTDMKDLTFVEQDTGTTQERAKELMATQARAQTEGKIVEHNLNKSKDDDTTTSNGADQV